MFKSVVLVLSTFGYLLFLINTVGVRAMIAPFVWACFVTTITYFFAIAGALSTGSTVVLVLGVVLGGLSLWRNGKTRYSHKEELVLICVWLIPIAVYYFAIPNDFLFLLWDEVGGWARSQKLIYETNALLNANSPFSLRSYPPGQQIFQYFITHSSIWTEKNLLLAQNVFIFSALSATAGALIKRAALASVAYLTIIPFIYFFKFDYNTIYCDPLVASVFSACLALALKPQQERHDSWILAICACGFILLKDIALIFFALVIFIYTLKAIGAQERSGDRDHFSSIKSTVKRVAIVIVPAVVVVVSWKWYVSVIGTAKTEFITLTLDSFMQDAYRQRAGLTLTAFIHAVLKPDYFVASVNGVTFGFSMITTIIVTSVVSVLVLGIDSKVERVTGFLIGLAMLAGAVGYLLFLLWLYLTYFTEYEGTRLASFDRYSMTYLLAWLSLSYAWALSALSRQYNNWLTLVSPIAMALLVFTLVPKKFYTDIKHIPLDQVSFEKRKATQNLSDRVRAVIKPGEKVYFLAQNTNGYERHLFDYAMLPNPPNDCWSIGEKYNEDDVWTCHQPLGYLIKDYAYLAIYQADERFWHDNAGLFEVDGRDKPRGVYRIEKTAETKLRLKFVSD